MSILLAVNDPDARQTWLGSDTKARRGRRMEDTGSKWVQFGTWAIGVSGWWRTTNFIQADPGRFLAGVNTPFDVTERLRAAYEQYGYKGSFDAEDHEGPPCYGDTFLVASLDGVWEIGPSFEVLEIRPRCVAVIGSGTDYALGAIWAYNERSIAMDAEGIIARCIDCAAQFDSGCGGAPWLGYIAEQTNDAADPALRQQGGALGAQGAGPYPPIPNVTPPPQRKPPNHDEPSTARKADHEKILQGQGPRQPEDATQNGQDGQEEGPQTVGT